MHDRDAVPVVLTLFGVTEPQDNPEGAVSEIVIVPEKPLSAENVTVDVSDDPGAVADGVLALTVKS